MPDPQITADRIRRWLSEQFAETDATLAAVTAVGESIRVAYRTPPAPAPAAPFGVAATEGTIAAAYAAAVENADIWTPPRLHAVALPVTGQDGVLWTLEAAWVRAGGDGGEWSDEQARRLLERASETLRPWRPDDGPDTGRSP